jgi:adenylate cyclase
MTRSDLEPDIVRSQLHRILSSPAFDASERNCRFFEYVVEEALGGRADRLKAYTIATIVFGRDSNFDAQNDPIVRIEARRVRRSLQHYYLTAGKNDDLMISIPKGAYAPAFQINETIQSDPPSDVERVQPDIKPEPHASFLGGPVIFVAPFEEDGGLSEFPNFTRGFTRALVVALTQFNDFVVYGAETSLRYSQNVSLDSLCTDLGIDFLVRGGISISTNRFNINVLLIDGQTGQSLWADNFGNDLSPEKIVAVRDEAANKIARTLAQPFGVIFSRKARDSEGKPPNDLAAYDSVIQYYLYWRTIDPDLHARARVSLEDAVARNPQYAEALACLSRVYIDAYRFGFDSGLGEDDPRDRALALAHRSIDLAPSSSRCHHALSLVYWFTNDIQASMHSLRTARSLNPNDTEIMADLGMKYTLVAEWDKGVPMLEEAYRRNPALPSTFRVGLSVFHLAHGQYEEALNEARKIDAPKILYSHILKAAAAAGLGLQEEAESAVKAITSLDPDYGQHVVTDLQKRSVHPDLISMIVDLLERAGLSGCEHGAKGISPLQVVAAERP